MTERMDCPIVARFTDEFCHDAELVAIGADWLEWFAKVSGNETAKLAAKALSAVAHRLRCFHRDFIRLAATRPPCQAQAEEPERLVDGLADLLAERLTADMPERRRDGGAR